MTVQLAVALFVLNLVDCAPVVTVSVSQYSVSVSSDRQRHLQVDNTEGMMPLADGLRMTPPANEQEEAAQQGDISTAVSVGGGAGDTAQPGAGRILTTSSSTLAESNVATVDGAPQVLASSSSGMQLQALQQLRDVLRSPNTPEQQQQQILQVLRSHPQLMAAFIQKRERLQRQGQNFSSPHLATVDGASPVQTLSSPANEQVMHQLLDVLQLPDIPEYRQQIVGLLGGNPELTAEFVNHLQVHQSLRRQVLGEGPDSSSPNVENNTTTEE